MTTQLQALPDLRALAVTPALDALAWTGTQARQSLWLTSRAGAEAQPVAPVLGGDGADLVIFDGSHAYTADLLLVDTGAGDDHLRIAAGGGQFVGSLAIDAGAGNDHLIIGHLEGNATGRPALIDGGDGADRIEVRDNGFPASIFANSRFVLSGGAGDDEFILQGRQINVIGAPDAIVLDGGPGIDRLHWNLSYQLTPGGSFVAGVDTYDTTGWRLEVAASNIERLVLQPVSAGATLRPTATEVMAITAGSDFDRETLGVAGISGSGATLFLEWGGQPVAIDLSGWQPLGPHARTTGPAAEVFRMDDALLVVDARLLVPLADPWPLAPQTLLIDGARGGLILPAEIFGDPSGVFSWSVPDGAATDLLADDASLPGIRVSGGLDRTLTIDLEHRTLDGRHRTIELTLRPVELGFRPVETTALFTAVAGDIDGDGRLDLVGSYQNADGSFWTPDLSALGLADLWGAGYSPRSTALADLDNDGDLDLVANSYTSSLPGNPVARVFANDGNGRFVDVPAFSALGVQGYGETIVVADFDNDGLTDFYLPYYFRNDPPADGGGSVAGSRLFINRGGLNFEDQTAQWPVVNRDGSLSLAGFGSAWDTVMPEGAQALDFNRDGLIDLYVNSHLFLNLGGAFFDAGPALGLPLVFEEGATFFDWNNDGWLDLLLIAPFDGPQLYEYRWQEMRFERVDAFPQRPYVRAFGIGTGDFNGDGWDDIAIVGPNDEQGLHTSTRLFLNDQGTGYSEFRSATLEGTTHYAGPLAQDLDGDGSVDLVLSGGSGTLINTSSAGAAVHIDLLGPGGERNQHGRIVQLRIADDPSDLRVLTRIVDSGSGYMAQRDYTLHFSDAASHVYRAEAYLVEYPSGQSIRLAFSAESGHRYAVYAPDGTRGARVVHLSTGQDLPWSLEYPVTDGADHLRLASIDRGPVDLGNGDDTVELFGEASNAYVGRTVDAGPGFDTLRWSAHERLDARATGVANVERLVFSAPHAAAAAAVSAPSPAEVAALTLGSDFDQSLLVGLGATALGHVLFVENEPGALWVSSDAGGWRLAGAAGFCNIAYLAFERDGQWMLTRDDVTVALDGGTLSGSAAPGSAGLQLAATAALANSLGALALRGSPFDDTLHVDAIHAYTDKLLLLQAGDGDDKVRVATALGQYAGSVRVEGGLGDDLLEIGHVEGSRSAQAGLFGGDGNDTLRVLATFAGVGLFGNGPFTLDGGAGDDTFELEGRQYNLRGGTPNTVDGGAGFDTLVWNLLYDLGTDTDQTGVDATGAPYPMEVGVRNLEQLILAPPATSPGRVVQLSATDVRAITADSDFDRAALEGLSIGGRGDTLFVDNDNALLSLPEAAFVGRAGFGGRLWNTYEDAGVLVLTSQPAVGKLLFFDGIHAYTTELLQLRGGNGDDQLRAAVAPGQYAGSVRLEGGHGNDLLEVGHVEGSRHAEAGLFGGDGDDTLRVRATFAGVGLFGNGPFALDGGAGDDTFELEGRQYNLLGDAIITLDGGAGFDKLVWNALYDLNRHTDQTGADRKAERYPMEVGVRNVEWLVLAPVSNTGPVVLRATDVSAITAGSDFDRSVFGAQGTGQTLFVSVTGTDAMLQLPGFAPLGQHVARGELWELWASGEVLVATQGSVAATPTATAQAQSGHEGMRKALAGLRLEDLLHVDGLPGDFGAPPAGMPVTPATTWAADTWSAWQPWLRQLEDTSSSQA